jgi:hypothetical protein
MSCHVVGQGAWMPGRPDVGAVLVPEATATAPGVPDIRGYPSRLMRGTSQLTRMCATVALQAMQKSGGDPNTIPTVFGSAYGEVTIAIEQLERMVTGDGRVSPARFKNSVHNASAGVFSIAHENRSNSASIAAGPLTVAYAFLEAQSMLDDGDSEVLVVVGDKNLPEPLSRLARWDAFAAAWVLSREPRRENDLGVRLSELQLTAVPASPVPEGLREHPCRAAYPLIAAIQRRERGRVSLGNEGDEAWSVLVESESTELR